MASSLDSRLSRFEGVGVYFTQRTSRGGHTHHSEAPFSPGLCRMANSHIPWWPRRCQPEKVFRCCFTQAFWDDPCEKCPPWPSVSFKLPPVNCSSVSGSLSNNNKHILCAMHHSQRSKESLLLRTLWAGCHLRLQMRSLRHRGIK